MKVLYPNWPCPAQVKSVVTTRQGGLSGEPYQTANLATHVGDDDISVRLNRQLLAEKTQIPLERWGWLQQVHGTQVLAFNPETPFALFEADASHTQESLRACVVMTADCLPVLFCNTAGTWVAAAHAGWRGLAKGILEETLRCAPAKPNDILAYLGPAIGPTAFEVGQDVVDVFTQKCCTYQTAWRHHFVPQPHKPGHYLADLAGLARSVLSEWGVNKVYTDAWCTYRDKENFYSYRRDGITGRMASAIWID